MGGNGESVVAAFAEAVDLRPIAAGEPIGVHAARTVADLRDRPDLEADTIRAATSNVEAVLDSFAAERSPATLEPSEASFEWVRTLVHRGVTAATIPRCYVVGHGVFEERYRAAVQATDLPPEIKFELFARMSRHLFGFVEKVSGDLVEYHERERDRWSRGSDIARMELVQALLSGQPCDASTARDTLGYDLNRRHVALLVWVDPRHDAPVPAPALKAAGARLAHRLGGIDVLAIQAGQTTVWLWAAGDHVGDHLGEQLTIDGGLMCAVGDAADGLEGFVRSHHEACSARRMAGILTRPPGSVVRYRSVALASMIASDPLTGSRFVASELGPLAADTDVNRRLRATLAVFFEEGSSWGRTAKRLGIHQNTVMYRVNQAEELLGRPVAERRLELEAALRLADAQDRLRAAAQRPAL